jgi:hypothetical protein
MGPCRTGFSTEFSTHTVPEALSRAATSLAVRTLLIPFRRGRAGPSRLVTRVRFRPQAHMQVPDLYLTVPSFSGTGNARTPGLPWVLTPTPRLDRSGHGTRRGTPHRRLARNARACRDRDRQEADGTRQARNPAIRTYALPSKGPPWSPCRRNIRRYGRHRDDRSHLADGHITRSSGGAERG